MYILVVCVYAHKNAILQRNEPDFERNILSDLSVIHIQIIQCCNRNIECSRDHPSTIKFAATLEC